jgi:hypothetical protein
MIVSFTSSHWEFVYATEGLHRGEKMQACNQ